jgi:glycosyltransferase involved in cell wall biosynthesis
MRVKILEGFARGLPIVSTSIGVEGIEARAGEHLLVADEPGEFATAVIRLLQDPDQAARLARAGRALVEERYDSQSALGGLDAIYSPAGGPRSVGSLLTESRHGLSATSAQP